MSESVENLQMHIQKIQPTALCQTDMKVTFVSSRFVSDPRTPNSRLSDGPGSHKLRFQKCKHQTAAIYEILNPTQQRK